MNIERISYITQDTFINEYLSKNKPIIVTDIITTWPCFSKWNGEYLAQLSHNLFFQIYDDLFNLQGIATIQEYIQKYFQRECLSPIPYMRAYCQFKHIDFAWADILFEKIKTDWSAPSFLPTTNYLFPFTPIGKHIYPHLNPFPAKGLFISAKGCQTSSHIDPWHSDAVLCQVMGEKHIYLLSPKQRSSTTYIDRLMPGEILYIPQGWTHEIKTLSDSISLTWNFVHAANGYPFLSYLTEGLNEQDKDIIKYFYS